MSMSRLIVAFGGQEQWDIVTETSLMRTAYDALIAALRQPEKHGSLFELIGCWGPENQPHRLLVRVADIKGLDLYEGIDAPPRSA